MTEPLRERTRRLIVALSITAAIALPCAAAAEDTQLDKMRAKVSAFVGNMMEKLGGSRIVYRVDTDALRDSAVTDLRDEVYTSLREGHIAFSGLAIRDGAVELKIADAKNREQLVRKLTTAIDSEPAHALGLSDGDGLVRLKPGDSAFAKRQHDLVEDSITMIEQRLKDSGIKLASVQPDGPDRIRIFLPGVMEPERVTAIFAKKVRVSFRMVDLSILAEQAQLGTPPAGSEVLFGFKDRLPYLVA